MAHRAQFENSEKQISPRAGALLARLAHSSNASSLSRYMVAIVAVGFAAFADWGLGIFVGPTLPPFIIFYPFVMVAALHGGVGPGLLATVMAALLAQFVLLPPGGSFSLDNPADLLAFAIFCATNILVSLLCGALRAARRHTLAEVRRYEASEERFRLFMDYTPALVWVKDEQGRYVYLNKAYEQRFGVSLDSCRGKTDLQLWDPNTAARLAQADQVARVAGRPVELTEETTERDGGTSFWHNTKFPYRDSSGKQFLASVGLDITPRKHLENALREQAQLEHLRADVAQTLQQPGTGKDFLQNVAGLLVGGLDAAFARVWSFEPSRDTLELQASAGLYTHLNGGHARIALGHLKIGRIAAQRKPLVTNQVVGDPHIPEQEWARQEGLVSFAGYPLVSEGHLLGVVGLFARHALSPRAVETFGAVADILAHALARKQAEQALLGEKEFSVEVINSLPGVFYVVDGHDRLRRWNRNLQLLSGYDAEEIVRMNVLDFVAPEYRTAATAAIAQVRQNGESSAELLTLSKAGRKVLFTFTSHRLEVDGQPGFVGVGIDITQRKRFERALRDREARLRLAVQTAELGTYERNLKTGRLLMNKACKGILGISAGLFPADIARRSVHPDDKSRVFAELERAFDPHLRAICAAEFRVLRPDSTIRWVAGRGRVMFDDTVTPARPVRFVGILNDITARKEALQALERRNLHLQLLHDASAQLLVGQEPIELLRRFHDHITRVFEADVFMLFQTDGDDERLRLLACAGVSEEEEEKLKTLRYGCAICAKPAEAFRPIIATHIQSREAPNRRFVRKLGFCSYLYYPLILNHRLHGALAFASHQRDDYDHIDLDFFHTVAGTLAAAIERERLEAELAHHAANLDRLVAERTAKLEEAIAELEHFSYTITHDMRAPLRAMRGFGTLLTTENAVCLHEDRRDLIRRISDAALRMDHLITDALQYSAVIRGEFPLRPTDPATIIRGITESYPQLQTPHAEVTVAPNLPTVLANEAALTQVFSNLLDNAVKFVPPNQFPRVSVSVERRGDFIRFWVVDNGIGIPPEYHDRIWEMFQRLSKAYEGTGIGLALVRKVVERMNGKTGVESKPGQGSRFWIELRAANSTP